MTSPSQHRVPRAENIDRGSANEFGIKRCHAPWPHTDDPILMSRLLRREIAPTRLPLNQSGFKVVRRDVVKVDQFPNAPIQAAGLADSRSVDRLTRWTLRASIIVDRVLEITAGKLTSKRLAEGGMNCIWCEESSKTRRGRRSRQLGRGMLLGEDRKGKKK